MIISKYNLKVDLDNGYNVIFNKLTRKYIIYPNSKKEKIALVIDNLNKQEYNSDEANVILKLAKAGIIVDDNDNEIKKIAYMINKSKYQDKRLLLVISPTMDCNFRCTYCMEERKRTYMTEKIEDNIIKFVEKMSKQIASIQVSWFGGEPTIVYNTVNRLNHNIKEICDKNGCEYSITMTSNGYLLTDEVLDELLKYNIKRLQITVDGDEEHHNKRRMLANGHGTYKTIMYNLNNAVNKGINVLLRINVSEENIDSVTKLLDDIPYENRKKLNIHISNLMQNDNPLALYNLYRKAIDKGYRFKHFHKQLQFCEASFANSFTIQPNGEIGPCQIGYDSDIKFGELTDNGNVRITNKKDYYDFIQLSPLDDEECANCDNLPVCLGGCNVSRFRGKKKCINKDKLGININELIKLEIYSDMKNDLINTECVI